MAMSGSLQVFEPVSDGCTDPAAATLARASTSRQSIAMRGAGLANRKSLRGIILVARGRSAPMCVTDTLVNRAVEPSRRRHAPVTFRAHAAYRRSLRGGGR